MKSTDRLLFGIVTGSVVLVAAALVVALTRAEPTYKSDDTPEGVAHNYLFALQREELDRAYLYISPSVKNYPVSASQFSDLVMQNHWIIGSDVEDTVRLHVDSSKNTGRLATVYVRETRFSPRGLFSGGQDTQTFRMHLQIEAGEWKIRNGERYWLHCLQERDGCQ